MRRTIRTSTSKSKSKARSASRSRPAAGMSIPRGGLTRCRCSKPALRHSPVSRSLRISHHTIITFDTPAPALGRRRLRNRRARRARYRWGYDGEPQTGDLPAAPQAVGLHQFRYDHLRVLGCGGKSASRQDVGRLVQRFGSRGRRSGGSCPATRCLAKVSQGSGDQPQRRCAPFLAQAWHSRVSASRRAGDQEHL